MELEEMQLRVEIRHDSTKRLLVGYDTQCFPPIHEKQYININKKQRYMVMEITHSYEELEHGYSQHVMTVYVK